MAVVTAGTPPSLPFSFQFALRTAISTTILAMTHRVFGLGRTLLRRIHTCTTTTLGFLIPLLRTSRPYSPRHYLRPMTGSAVRMVICSRDDRRRTHAQSHSDPVREDSGRLVQYDSPIREKSATGGIALGTANTISMTGEGKVALL